MQALLIVLVFNVVRANGIRDLQFSKCVVKNFSGVTEIKNISGIFTFCINHIIYFPRRVFYILCIHDNGRGALVWKITYKK